MRYGKDQRLDPARLRDNPRATIAAWQRFESVVRAARQRFPSPYIYSPSNIQPTTAATRLRDAIRGAIAFNYLDDLDATASLREWYNSVEIRNTTTSVTIGPRTRDAVPLEGVESTPSGYSYASLSHEETAAFCTLLNTGKLLGPVTIGSPPNTDLLSSYPNVQFLPRPDGSLVLL